MHLTLFSGSIARDKRQELEFWLMLLWKLLFLYIVHEALEGFSKQPHHIRRLQYFLGNSLNSHIFSGPLSPDLFLA